MKTKTGKKAKTYVCLICSKGKKSSRKIKCCGKDMIVREKGTWND